MRIHLTGIGGVGMAGLAFLLKARGHAVDGCDLKATPRTRWLEACGIPVAVGHDAKHVEGKDLVIVTPAVAKDNPKYVAALGEEESLPLQNKDFTNSFNRTGRDSGSPTVRGLKCRGEVLAEIVNAAPDSIAVCGSHGKTTTATFVAKLLIALGESVEWAIGGETGAFPVAGCAGAARTPQPQLTDGAEQEAESAAQQLGMRSPDRSVLVVEADESDGTLALYHAKTLVVTNCEYDHPDHFKTVADYFACYDRARANAARVIEGSDQGPVSSEQLGIFQDFKKSATDHCSLFIDHCMGDPNALLAVRVALARGHSPEAVAAVLPRVTAELPDRRFQRILPMTASGTADETRDVTPGASDARRETRDVRLGTPLVFTDYGHHPTEIRYAISRARSLLSTFQPSDLSAPQPRLRVLFQPHRYSRTAAFKRAFAEALALADEVVVCPIYSAFEKPVEGGDSCDLYAELRELELRESEKKGGGGHRKVKVFLAKSCEDAWEHARNSMRPGDVTLIQGAGDIINLVPAVKKDLSFALHLISPVSFPRRRIWIGAGTNTVKTDLDLSVEYVKTTGPAAQTGVAHPLLRTLFPWMAGIPGTLGGWVKMNAGAHGHAIGEVIESVQVDGMWIPASACGFSYRHSDLVGEIQDVRFKTENGERGTGNGECWSAEYFLAKRRRFPAHTRGSVFRNPEGGFAGQLLEACGCKGLRVGGAYVWEGHANVIVAPPDSATASDFLALMQIMRNRVLLRKGICLVPEVCF